MGTTAPPSRDYRQMNRNEAVLAATSEPRMAPYLIKAQGNMDRAISIYTWHLELSGALHELLGVVEVAVRNAIDQQLQLWNPTMSQPNGVAYPREWTLNPAPAVKGALGKQLKTAKSDALRAKGQRDHSHPRKGLKPTHDDILSQITFGAWPHLLPSSQPKNQRRQLLWDKSLKRAFPLAESGRNITAEKIVHDRIKRLAHLRNRVAHCENLLDANIPARITDAHKLLGYINPAVRDFASSINRVTKVNSRRASY
ncbi:Abi family protein [Corynebacterium variabile]|uniref:Abi family protein n=1 Tax=Corynebacterium variabile TaxID=1727 RepID=UPI00264995D7|nr:Abi family protein [Corynebacterium variabile]MDN6676401.1 Abi family protein [Corynebacterium variabile]MDN6844133.1 Abi family protein [Corynebacterium variabile]